MNTNIKQLLPSLVDPLMIEVIGMNCKLDVIIDVLKEAKLLTDQELQDRLDKAIKDFTAKLGELTKGLQTKPIDSGLPTDLVGFPTNGKVH